jgi:hypothetical protein
MIYNFKDVAIQLNGKVNFKELISTSWKMYDNPNGALLHKWELSR